MNDRINILAEQAGFYVSESRLEILAPDSTTDNVTEALREFAELIVRECMANLYLNGYDDAMIQIQKHFGVEE
jgi:ABC-type Fe3+-hydroxamate transport system substrate-binding protein